MIRAECEALKAVAVWDNYGTFSREDISTMISAYDIKRIRGKERKSGFWSLKTFFWIITVWTRLKRFQSLDLIWSSDEKDVVLNYGEKGGIRVHDFCTVVCNRWLTDDLLNFLFQSMNGETTAHYFQVMSEPLMLSQSLRERFFDVLERKLLSGNLEYIHFALNVKKCEKTEVVTVSSRGNHWTYFVFSVSLNEMYYGDSLGWPTPVNLFSFFEPIFELLKPTGFKTTVSTKLAVMHAPNSLGLNGQHECCYLCYQAFPKQRCGNIGGFAPLLMCCLAATFPVIWKSILRDKTYISHPAWSFEVDQPKRVPGFGTRGGNVVAYQTPGNIQPSVSWPQCALGMFSKQSGISSWIRQFSRYVKIIWSTFIADL